MARLERSRVAVRSREARPPGARSNAAGVATREQLLSIAERLFAARGIDGVSLREIAAQAGIRNPGAVHYHFGSKEVLVQAVLERRAVVINERRSAYIDALIARGDLSARTLAEATILPLADELDDEHGDYLGFLAQLARARPELVLDDSNRAFGSGVAMLRGQFVARGLIPPAPLGRARMRVVANLVPAALADYQRALRQGTAGLAPRPLYVSYLIDLLAAIITAPCSPGTIELLRRSEEPE